MSDFECNFFCSTSGCFKPCLIETEHGPNDTHDCKTGHVPDSDDS